MAGKETSKDKPRSRGTNGAKPEADAAGPKPVRKARTAAKAPMAAASDSGPAIDGDRRRAMIAEAAYYRAERRGFSGGDEMRDWLEAEAEIAQQLGRAQ